MTREALGRAARLGDPGAGTLRPDVPAVGDLYELAADVRAGRHGWTEQEPCIRLAIAAARFCSTVCRELLPALEAATARAAIAAAESWCLAQGPVTAASAREACRAASVVGAGLSPGDLLAGVLGAAGSVAEAAGAGREHWRRASAAALGESISVAQFHAARRLRERLGRAASEAEKEASGDSLHRGALEAVREEVLPWLLGDWDPLEDGAS